MCLVESSLIIKNIKNTKLLNSVRKLLKYKHCIKNIKLYTPTTTTETVFLQTRNLVFTTNQKHLKKF